MNIFFNLRIFLRLQFIINSNLRDGQIIVQSYFHIKHCKTRHVCMSNIYKDGLS